MQAVEEVQQAGSAERAVEHAGRREWVVHHGGLRLDGMMLSRGIEGRRLGEPAGPVAAVRLPFVWRMWSTRRKSTPSCCDFRGQRRQVSGGVPVVRIEEGDVAAGGSVEARFGPRPGPRRFVAVDLQAGEPAGEGGGQLPGAVGGTVIDHDDFHCRGIVELAGQAVIASRMKGAWSFAGMMTLVVAGS